MEISVSDSIGARTKTKWSRRDGTLLQPDGRTVLCAPVLTVNNLYPHDAP